MKMEQEQVHQKLFKIGQLSGEGSKYHLGDDLENALECYKEAYKLAREINDDKTERTCAFNLGAEYVAIGQYEDGLVHLHKAVPPKDESDEKATGDLYFNMGLGYEKLDKEQEALRNFLKAHKKYGKYERNKTDMQIVCLEKCFKLYHEWKDYTKAADICKQMADIFNGTDELSKAEKLCERASELRLANEISDAVVAALGCNEVMEKCNPQGQDCMVAGKVWNDLGLVFTQLQQYDEATHCFEKAVEQVRNSHKMNPQLEAVVLQNLGAAYNFEGEYQRAIKFHEDAATKYASINYRNGQGQCFTNLAFALSQLGDREMKQAEIAFHHALQASIDTGDLHMKWQALEGLGAVNYNQGQVQEAVDYFIQALQCVGNNRAASERIKNKMMYALKGPDYVGQGHTRGQGQMIYTGTHMTPAPGRRVLMSTHGPLEEHNKMSTTPRSGVIETVMTKRLVPVAGEQPAMAEVQDTSPPKPRRLIRLRKHGSIGPIHHPKVAQGLGSLTYDSPRNLASDRRNTILQEDTSEEESSSESSTSTESDSDSGEDEADQAKERISSEKMNQIFARPVSPQLSPGVHDGEEHLSKYEAQLRAKEEEEEEEDEDSKSSSDDDDSTDDSSDEDSDDSDESETERKKYQVARQKQQQQQQAAESHPDISSSASGSESDGDGDDENEEKDPYATIDTTTKLRQKQGQGNVTPDETGFMRQRSGEGRKSENFFDSDRSSLDNKERPSAGEDTEGPYHTLKFSREDNPDDQTAEQSVRQGQSGSAMKFEELPRGQKEVIMAQYHHEHQSQVAPELPARSDEKSSKTCVIM